MKSNYFSVLIGPEEDKMLNIIVQLALDNPNFARMMEKHNIKGTLLKFKDQMAEGCKKVEWCNFKGCAGGDCEHKKDI